MTKSPNNARQKALINAAWLRLAELELIDRERRTVERRIKAAKFPVLKPRQL